MIRKIVMDNPSCVMLKHEDWPGLEKISALRGFQKDGSLRPLSILTGNGALFLDFEMERGADGAMTGYAFPEMLIDVVRLSKEGPPRRRARSVRRPSAADPLRAAAGRLGWRCENTCCKSAASLPPARSASRVSSITATAKAEVDYLLSRVARVDRRANCSRNRARRARFRWPKPSQRASAPRRSCCCATAPREHPTTGVAREIEVFMMVRHHEIEFSSGALVFPGGSVDKSDREIIARPELYSGGEGQ